MKIHVYNVRKKKTLSLSMGYVHVGKGTNFRLINNCV